MRFVRGMVAKGSLLCCLAAGVAEAQAPSSERLMEAGGAWVSRVQNSDSNISTRIQRSLGWARLKAPISLGEDFALVLGVSYEGQAISYSNFVTRNVGGTLLTQSNLPTGLHSLDANVGFVWRFAEDWALAANFTPGIHSDFSNIQYRDVIWTGNVLFLHPFGDKDPIGGRNRIGFGFAYTDRFGTPLPIPLVRLDWYPSEDWFVRGTLPFDLDLGYRVSSAFSVGVGGLLHGYIYRLEATPFTGQVVRYREVEIGPFLDLVLTERIHVRVTGGVSTAQRFEFRDESNNNTIISGNFKSAGFFRGSLYYALF